MLKYIINGKRVWKTSFFLLKLVLNIHEVEWQILFVWPKIAFKFFVLSADPRFRSQK